MALTILKGTIVSAPALGRLEAVEQGYLVAEDGIITGVFPVLPEQYTGAAVEDWGSALILQSLADLHLHAPQYPLMGMGMDLPLLDWLNAYAFPTEARCADLDYARALYRTLARDLAAGGTTRVCMFSSLHTDATLILMEELERAGLTGYVGKVNMDRNGAPGLLEETTEDSRRETLRWLEACQDFSPPAQTSSWHFWGTWPGRSPCRSSLTCRKTRRRWTGSAVSIPTAPNTGTPTPNTAYGMTVP